MKASKMSSGQTKDEVIVVDVLVPNTMEIIINDLKNSFGYFSVS